MTNSNTNLSPVQKIAADAASAALANQPCAACKYVTPTISQEGKNPMLECRRYPPTLFLIPVISNIVQAATAIQKPPKLLKQSGFPNCMDTCGEFVPRGKKGQDVE